MEVSKEEMLALLHRYLDRYEREETRDAQMSLETGDGVYVSNGNEKAWVDKQRKIQIIKAIIKILEEK
jgi:hypothetical protein